MVLENIVNLFVSSVILAIIDSIGVSIGLYIINNSSITKKAYIYGFASLSISFIITILLSFFNVFEMKGLILANEGLGIMIMSIVLGIVIFVFAGKKVNVLKIYMFIVYLFILISFSIIYILIFIVWGPSVISISISSAISSVSAWIGFKKAFKIQKKITKTNRAIIWLAVGISGSVLFISTLIIGGNYAPIEMFVSTFTPIMILALIRKNHKELIINGELLSSCYKNPNQKMCKQFCKTNSDFKFCKK